MLNQQQFTTLLTRPPGKVAWLAGPVPTLAYTQLLSTQLHLLHIFNEQANETI
jgi:hypothetical protein